jgi:hypothetical protein
MEEEGIELWKEIMINYEFIGIVVEEYLRTDSYVWFRIVMSKAPPVSLLLKVNYIMVSPFICTG